MTTNTEIVKSIGKEWKIWNSREFWPYELSRFHFMGSFLNFSQQKSINNLEADKDWVMNNSMPFGV